MANSIAAAPAALAQRILPKFVGLFPLVNAFSTNLTGDFARGKKVQVSLIGGDPAIEFGATGYAESQDADIEAVEVTLKHIHSTKKFTPLNLQEYGEDYIVNAFVENAVNELVLKAHQEVASVVTAANFAASETITAANFSYDEMVDLNTDLSVALAARQRAFVASPAYLGALRKDATLTQPFSAAAANNTVVTQGSLGQVAGLDVFEFSQLPTNGENLGAFACGTDAIAIASALPSAAMFEGEVDQAIDPSGLAVQVLKSKAYDGFLRLTATLMIGAAKGRGTSLKRVTTA